MDECKVRRLCTSTLLLVRVSQKQKLIDPGQRRTIVNERIRTPYSSTWGQKTGAYIELENDPLWPIFDKVIQLLNNLRLKDHIRVSQLNKMMLKRDKIVLAYLYFILKAHKVTNIYILSCY